MNQTPPKNPFVASGLMLFQTIIVEQTLIEPFRGGPRSQDGVPLGRTTADSGRKAQILMLRHVNGAAIS